MLLYMKRHHGDHLKWKEVKTSIIEFVISRTEAVLEPDIRDFLEKEYGIRDQGNIKTHLKELQYKPYACIEKIPGKPGLANKWDIKTLENLKNIMHSFPKIRLNKYGKSLNIILKESNYEIKTFNGFKYYIRLLLSTSFFNLCIENDIETLQYRAWEVYLEDKGFNKVQLAKTYLVECYGAYIKQHTNSVISEETFLNTIQEMVPEHDQLFYEEIFIKMLKEKFPEILEEIKYGKCTEITKENIEIYEKMYNAMQILRQQKLVFENSWFDLILEHSYYHDILTGVASPEEIEFAKKTKENLSKYYDSEEPENALKNMVLCDLKEASKILVKYKQPSVSGKIYNDPKYAYQDLKEFFSFLFQK